MKLDLKLSGDILVITLPERYLFEEMWGNFTESIPERTDFKKSKYCIVDGSGFKELGSLGMGSEIFILRDKFIANGGIDFVLTGFDKHELFVLEKLVPEGKNLPKTFETLQQAEAYFTSY